MVQDQSFSRYAVLAKLERDVQNPQEFASIWREIRSRCESIEVTIEDAFATFGQFDFLILVDAPSRDIMFKAALIMTRQGVNVQTLSMIPLEDFGDIVKDI